MAVETATALLLNAPSNLEFGIDLNVWKTGPKFKGLKMITPGIHFIYYSLSSTNSNQISFRSGFWHDFTANELLVKLWDISIEDFIQETNLDQLERYRFSNYCFNRLDLKEFDAFLGAYPQISISDQNVDTFVKWKQQTSCITVRLMDQILPYKNISAMCSVSRHSEVWNESKNADLAKLNISSQLANLNITDDSEMRSKSQEDVSENWMNFTVIDLKRSFPPGSTASEITFYSLDKSYLLDLTIAQNYYEPKELIGELQLCFLMLHLGQIYDAFEQWKLIFHLICTSNQAIARHIEIYTLFLETAFCHLQEFPADFFINERNSENFIRDGIMMLKENLESVQAPLSFALNSQKLSRLVQFVDLKFDWDIAHNVTDMDGMDDDYLPTVVDENHCQVTGNTLVNMINDDESFDELEGYRFTSLETITEE